MLTGRQADIKAANVDKENETGERMKNGALATASGSMLSKRQHALMATPVNNQKTANGTTLRACPRKGWPLLTSGNIPVDHTPSSSSKLKHPILRDITNSSNPTRVFSDVYPALLHQPGRQPMTSKLGSSSGKRVRDSRPSVESKLRLMTEPALTIDELLALPDDQLPAIEGPAAPINEPGHYEQWPDLPPIIDDITDLGTVEAMDEGQIREREVARRFQEHLSEAIRSLVIDPADFGEKWTPTPTSTDENDLGDAPNGGCYMFDDLPPSVALKL